MSTSRSALFLRPSRLAALAAASALTCGVALAVGDGSGTLGEAGGKVAGDISTEPGEADRIGIDLVSGEFLDVRFNGRFRGSVDLRDPTGDPVTMDASPGFSVSALVSPVPSTGRHEISVRSSDGTQGSYTLKVKAGWAKKQAVTGVGDTDVDVWMPAGGSLKGAFSSDAGAVRIVELLDPSGNPVAGPVEGRNGKVKLATFRASAGGRYTLRLGGSGNLSGSVVRKAPKSGTQKLKIANGLTPVSFEDDGVAQLFRSRCAECHSWSTSFAGVAPRASSSLGRMRTGNMPQGGGRIGQEDLALVENWIRTGRGR